MNQVPKHIKEISLLLEAVTTLTGMAVVWKKPTGRAEETLSPHQSLHCNSFCKKIKSRKELVRKCSANDCERVMKKSGDLRKPFVNECHAGVAELILPVVVNNALDSVLFMGPFKTGGSRCVHGFARKEYDLLTQPSRKRFKAVETLFAVLARFIVERKEIFVREQIIAKARNKKIQTALAFIDSNFHKTISASDAARECGLSVSRFVHLFKQECGLGFSEYMTVRKVDESKKLLADTDLKIFEVASQCGYANQSYFGLVFKKVTGTSPAGYRRKFRTSREP